MNIVFQQCAGCMYWFNTQGAEGVCKRNPPSPYPKLGPLGRIDVLNIRPVTQANDGCGEWDQTVNEIDGKN